MNHLGRPSYLSAIGPASDRGVDLDLIRLDTHFYVGPRMIPALAYIFMFGPPLVDLVPFSHLWLGSPF